MSVWLEMLNLFSCTMDINFTLAKGLGMVQKNPKFSS